MALCEALERDGGGRNRGISAEEARRAAVAATERRLSALSNVQARIGENAGELAELENLGPEAVRGYSGALLGVLRPGMRLDDEEAHAMQLSRLRGRIAADEREVRKLTLAMDCLSGDPYYAILELKYYRKLSDMDIAERLNCDSTTVSRNRRRIIGLLAERLYGL